MKRLTLHEEIALYASDAAGTGDDLDEQLEAAGVDYLNDAGKCPKRRIPPCNP